MRPRALISLISLLSGSAIAQSVAAQLPTEVASWLKSYAASRTTFDHKSPHFYADATEIVEGRLDAESATALVFTLEGVRGGNDYLQYLSVFWNRGGHHVFCCAERVGGKGIGDVAAITISEGAIHLSGKQFVPGSDAMCCPSRPYTRDLTVVGSKLVVKSGL
jgi:hypothetical protein